MYFGVVHRERSGKGWRRCACGKLFTRGDCRRESDAKALWLNSAVVSVSRLLGGLLLAVRAVERGPLCLHNTADLGITTAGAEYTFAVIDAMVILIATVLVERISEGAVVEGGAFEEDGLIEYVLDGVVQFGDAVGREFASRAKWRDTGKVQDFAGVDITDSGDECLVEESDFDGPAGLRQSLPPFRSGAFESIRPESLLEHLEFCGGQQRECAESAAVPEHQFFGLPGGPCRAQFPGDSQVIEGWWVCYQQQSGHTGFDDEDAAGVELE